MVFNKIDIPCEAQGIDIDKLFEEKVLSNKRCFWSLLQCYTDRLHHYYYDEEKYIIKSINRLDKENLLTVKVLERLKMDVQRLNEFINLNVDLFVRSVRTYDEKHKTDTFDEEFEYFKETYPFIDGHRLFSILEAIDMHIYNIESTSKAARSKKASSILSLVQSLAEQQDVVKCSNVIRKDRSVRKLKALLKLSLFMRRKRGKR